MTTRVLFLCPHSAGKSLLAATYFRAAASRVGLPVSIDVAGPDPDEHNMSNVVAALEAQGHHIAWEPALVEQGSAESADLIVSVGCSRDSIPTTRPVIDWDVPTLSDDFAGCMQSIHQRAEALVRELTDAAG